MDIYFDKNTKNVLMNNYFPIMVAGNIIQNGLIGFYPLSIDYQQDPNSVSSPLSLDGQTYLFYQYSNLGKPNSAYYTTGKNGVAQSAVKSDVDTYQGYYYIDNGGTDIYSSLRTGFTFGFWSKLRTPIDGYANIIRVGIASGVDILTLDWNYSLNKFHYSSINSPNPTYNDYVITTGGTFNPLNWTYHCVTWNNQTRNIRIYLNGGFLFQRNLSSRDTSGANILLQTTIINDNGPSRYAQNMVIYNRDLDDSEILSLYNNS